MTIMSRRELIPDPTLTVLVTVLREDAICVSSVGRVHLLYTGKGLIRLRPKYLTCAHIARGGGVKISSLVAQGNHLESYEK